MTEPTKKSVQHSATPTASERQLLAQKAARGLFLKDIRDAFSHILMTYYLGHIPPTKIQLSAHVVEGQSNGLMGIFFFPCNNVTAHQKGPSVSFQIKRSNKEALNALKEFFDDLVQLCNEQKIDIRLQKYKKNNSYSLQAKTPDDLMSLLRVFCDVHKCKTLDSPIGKLILQQHQTFENLSARFLKEVTRMPVGDKQLANPFIYDPSALLYTPTQPFLSITHAYVAANRAHTVASIVFLWEWPKHT